METYFLPHFVENGFMVLLFMAKQYYVNAWLHHCIDIPYIITSLQHDVRNFISIHRNYLGVLDLNPLKML